MYNVHGRKKTSISIIRQRQYSHFSSLKPFHFYIEMEGLVSNLMYNLLCPENQNKYVTYI